MKHKPLILRNLGTQDYETIWHAMQKFTELRTDKTTDEIWLLQHPPVYTLGLNGKNEHLLHNTNIPLINIDRGGQITYHGPGQTVLYVMLDLKRANISVRQLVELLENTIIQFLSEQGISANNKKDAPGVYIQKEKIAAIGLRIKKNRSYHGLSVNLDMDLEPFSNINPCGYKDLKVTDLKHHMGIVDTTTVNQQLIQDFCQLADYRITQTFTDLP